MNWFGRCLSVSLLMFPLCGLAASSEERGACFEVLQASAVNAHFFTPEEEALLASQEYDNFEFTRPYAAASSYGIDVTEPLFEYQYSGFGASTAYRHPRKNFLKVSQDTERWDFEAKQFLVQDLFVKNGEESVFQGCVLTRISGAEPLNADDYWYDLDVLESPILKASQGDQNYLVRFNQNESMTFDNQIFATWKRVFVYPEGDNSFLNLYKVFALAYGDQIQDLTSFEGFENGETNMPVQFFDVGGQYEVMDDMPAPKGFLAPSQREGFEQFFPLEKLYFAIENKYPAFGKYLAASGVFSVSEMKNLYDEVISKPEYLEKIQYFLWPAMDVRTLQRKEKEGSLSADEKVLVQNYESNVKEVVDFSVKNLEAVEVRKGKVAIDGGGVIGQNAGGYIQKYIKSFEETPLAGEVNDTVVKKEILQQDLFLGVGGLGLVIFLILLFSFLHIRHNDKP